MNRSGCILAGTYLSAKLKKAVNMLEQSKMKSKFSESTQCSSKDAKVKTYKKEGQGLGKEKVKMLLMANPG